MVAEIPFEDVSRQRFGPPDGPAVWIYITRENDPPGTPDKPVQIWGTIRWAWRRVAWSLRLTQRRGWTVSAYSGNGDRRQGTATRVATVFDRAAANALAGEWRDELAPK